MLYELIAIVSDTKALCTQDLTNLEKVRPGNLKEIREYVITRISSFPSPYLLPRLSDHEYRIASIVGSQVLHSGGVVRGITNWGPFRLPKPVTRHQSRYHQGHYFIVRFDSSSKTQESVQRTLKLDPRMIRFSVVKMGSKLEEIKDVPGRVDWNQGYQSDERKQGRLALG